MSRVIVYHGTYGCESGCCGHYVELDEGDRSEMTFDHPDVGESNLDFAKRLVIEFYGEEHVSDLDWENCFIWDD